MENRMSGELVLLLVLIYFAVMFLLYIFVIRKLIDKLISSSKKPASTPEDQQASSPVQTDSASAESTESAFSIPVSRSRMFSDRRAAAARDVLRPTAGSPMAEYRKNHAIPQLEQDIREKTGENYLLMGFGAVTSDIDFPQDSNATRVQIAWNSGDSYSSFQLTIDGKKFTLTNPVLSALYAFPLEAGVHTVVLESSGKFLHPFRAQQTFEFEANGTRKYFAVDLMIYCQNVYRNNKLLQGTDAHFLVEEIPDELILIDEYIADQLIIMEDPAS